MPRSTRPAASFSRGWGGCRWPRPSWGRGGRKTACVRLDPQLGGDEQIGAVDATLGDGPAHRVLVAVGRGGVQVAVAGRQRLRHDLFGLLGGDLEDPNPRIGIWTPLLRVTVGTLGMSCPPLAS